jgi:coenzyme F420 hydrogenase subunit beta
MECGAWREMWAAHSNDPDILERAASGGVMTAIALYLITSGKVDGAVVTRIKYGSPGPRPETYIARFSEELLDAQGSKYCPVDAMKILPQAGRFFGKLVFIGTPCQIAALRLLQQLRSDLKEKFPYTIGNFCGGFSDFRQTDTIIKRQKIAPDKVVNFRYRGGGQPGSMLIRDDSGKTIILPYPSYMRKTGFVKHKRCRLCVDAMAELADFSCGDAWIPRFLDSEFPWSLIISRTKDANAILKSMAKQRFLTLKDVSVKELKKSQHLNLFSKKTRQYSRRRFMRFWGERLPDFDGGYPEKNSGILLEYKVQGRNFLLYISEILGIYPLLARLLRRYY